MKEKIGRVWRWGLKREAKVAMEEGDVPLFHFKKFEEGKGQA